MSQQIATLFEPVIKWSGSKRSQSQKIVALFPKFSRYYEPFLGGGSILFQAKPDNATCGDICKPLIEFWQMLQDNPASLVKSYQQSWERLQTEGYMTFYEIRDRYNTKPNPHDLLFLSRTCVNGLIRFNKEGKFNNSLHHTRKGIQPERLQNIIHSWSKQIQNYEFIYGDYFETTKTATKDDLVYLDPPYFNNRGRYYGRIDHDDFLEFLEELNSKKIKFILSFDGSRGEKDYTVDLPRKLYKKHVLLDSGNASFRKVMDKKIEFVRESIYLNF